MTRVKKVNFAYATKLILTTAFAATTLGLTQTAQASDLTDLATQIANVADKVHNDPTYSILAQPVVTIVSDPSFDWDQALFGSDSLTAAQQTAKGTLIGSIQQMTQFTATTEPAAEVLINNVVTELQSLNPAITQTEAIAFLSALESQTIGAMATVAHTKEAVANALYSSLVSAEAGSPAIQSVFGSPAGGGGAVPPTDSGFSTVLSTQTVSTSGGTFGATAGNTGISVTLPSNVFTQAQQVTLASTDETQLTGVPVGTTATAAVGVHFPDGVTPSAPITLTVTNSGIHANSKVYKVTGDKWVAVDATMSNGKAVIKFTSDPDFVIVTPRQLKPNMRAIYLNGKELAIVPGGVKNKTVYMPIWYVIQALEKGGLISEWNGFNWTLHVPTSYNPDFSNIQPGYGQKSIYLNGVLMQHTDSDVMIDPYSGKPTTYMPMWYVMKVFIRAHIQSTWDGVNWNLITTTK